MGNGTTPASRAPSAIEPRPRTAIIDIGSNSIRLVVYQGPARLPAILFNEKVMAGLGRGFAATGAIEPAALRKAHTALARFAAIARVMEVERLRTVATAAVRDASNGGELIAQAELLGLHVEILPGEQEALAAGEGVLSGIPDADGIVGDLGGGSLELVRVGRGRVGERVSLPLGVLRIARLREWGPVAFEHKVAAMVEGAGWGGKGRDLPLYLVGGSWRALAKFDMALTEYPLPVIHQYVLSAARVAELEGVIAPLPRPRLREIAGVNSTRAGLLGDAAALLSVLLRGLGATTTIVSSFGLREGLLHGALDPATRAQDPLIVGAREEGRLLGRFPEHGDLLDRWIAPLFAATPGDGARLRHAACLLADVGWHANPDFRAERGIETALHGSWVAIDGAGRAILAQCLATALAGGVATPEPLDRLATAPRLREAIAWGLAIRLGQRLSGGVAGPLDRSRLVDDGAALTLHLAPADRALYGEAVEKRHAALAAFLDRAPLLAV
ncbi:Ppx/GppA family phosphatase [uncultured Sphingomonas sp.]|uniref:Ppx/GppA phosphatase family protein n=1 Tax=uncultured Sphingomonas sp. TaxID=158754 RepID=UPI0035CADA42